MLVKHWMNEDVVTVNTDDSMQQTIKLIKERAVKMLPVLEKGKLVGIITDRDLKRASASDATTLDVHELLYLLSKIKIKDIMTKKPITVSPLDTVEETAQILLDKDISGAPVLDGSGKLVGTITQREIFKVLISVTGVDKAGVQFALLLEDRPGSIKEVADVIREHNGRMVSILSSYEGAPDGKRYVFIRVRGIDSAKVKALRDALQQKATVRYVVNHLGDKAETEVLSEK